MHRKFDVRRYLTAFFIGIFAVVGSIVAIDAPARAAVAGNTSEIDWAGSFTGTNTGPSSSSITPISTSDTTFSTEMWIKPGARSGDSYMMLLGQALPTSGCPTGRYALSLHSTTDDNWQIHYAMNSCGVTTTERLVPKNAWTHLAHVVDGNTSKIYINGQLAFTDTTSWTGPFSTGVVLASALDGVHKYIGLMDQVKVWDFPLTESQVESSMHTFAAPSGLASNLKAHFDFNEGSGDTIYNRVDTTKSVTGTSIAREDVKSKSRKNGKTIVTFPRTYLTPLNGWTIPSGAVTANVLAVAGGGAGGSRHAGGGGAGELREFSNYSLTPTSVLPIKVGQGGRGLLATTVNPQGNKPRNGQSTTFGAVELAGGGAGAANDSVTNGAGQNGGSGGGSTYYLNAAGASVKTGSGLGNAGGAGSPAGSYHGGGGGGAGGAGANATSGGPGNGGAGYESSIEGDLKCYAAGGGGGASTNVTPGQAGSCATATSRASAGTFNTDALPAGANSGSGGGAGGLSGSTNMGSGAGGSGIVVIAYAEKNDTALDFPASVDAQYVATNEQVVPSHASFTFETWFNADALRSGNNWNDIFRQQATGSNYEAFGLGVYNGQIQFIHSVESTGPGTLNTADVTNNLLKISTGSWYHVALTSTYSVSGSNRIYDWNVYVNGQLALTKTYTTASPSVLGKAQLSIGNLYGNTNTRNWDGKLDQIKVWNGALTQAEIQKSMHTYGAQNVVSSSSSTLRAHFDFNSTDTSTLFDQTGNGYDFALKSGATAPSLYQLAQQTSSTYKFDRSFLTTWGGWISPSAVSDSRILIVAGGGGGGRADVNNSGGGGGAGAVYTATGASIPVSPIPVTVGQGGFYGTSATNAGSNGQDSLFGTLLVGGGGGGNGWNSSLATPAGRGGSGYVAGGNGGGGRGEAGASSAVYGLGGSGGTAATQTFNGVSFTSQAGVAGNDEYSGDAGSGGLGGANLLSVRTSSISGSSVIYGKPGPFSPYTAGAQTPGSGGSTNYSYGGTVVDAGSGANGVIFVSLATAATPTISSHPANITKSAGETATFSVTASTSDAGTLSYQWEVSANNGSTWMNVSGGTGSTTSSYTTPSLVSADLGKQYRVVVTNSLSGATATATSNAATLTIGLDKINVNFDELNFDYANVSHIVGTNGKSQGNKVLFLNVTTKNGVQVDALVTTETLTNATITNYETGARAGGANSYFQTDVDFSAGNGFAQFKFDFYKHGVAGSAGNPCTTANPTCSGATKVVIQNVNVSAIDIDYYQWNDFTQAESYSLAGNTKLKECLISVANAAVGGTCTARTAPSTFPADMRFQGSPDTARTNDPVDMAIVTYADIETFRIKFGRDRAGSPNYYGVAFKALDWGTTTPQTTGGTNYAISYDVNGASSGSQSGTHVGAAGSLFTVLSAGTAVRTGYTFAGWATTANATTATYTGSSKVTMPGSNLTLYAVWTPIKYTLTYNVNGGTAAPAAGSFETGTNNVTLSSTVPTRTGFVFGGWDTVVNSGSGNVNYSSGATYSMPASNVTLYAKWTAANGTLSYNANGGSTTQADVTAAGGSTTTVANGSNTTRTGYDFVGWNSKADGTGTSYAVGSTFTLTANVTTTIYAQWTLSKYTLVFNVNGGVGTPQSQSYVQGATTTMPVSNPTRSGFTFAGWNSQADGNGTAYNGSFLMPGNNLTLYAKWTAITYNVIYNNNSATYSGATGTVTDSTNYTAAQSVTVAAGTGLSNTTGSTTYVFTGWNTAADGSGTDFVPSSTFSMPAGNRTLYAMWVDASIEIAYNANGGSGAPANANTTLNSTFTISSTVPVRAGYTFAGWNVQDGNPGGGPHSAGGTITPNSNEVLVAQWTAVNYTVTFDTDGGSTAPSQQTNKNIGNTISISATAPTKTGYTFLGWKDAAGNVYPAGGSFIMGAGNVTLTAQWQGNAYTLTYDANGGSGAPVAESRNYTASANLSATQPTRTGYTFQGWNTLVGGGGTAYNASDSFTMPNSNSTLYAQWTANSYVLAYNTQGGSTAPSSSNKSYNSTVTVSSSTPTRTGFTFAGWNTVAAGTGTTYLPSGTFSMPDANVTLYSQWTKTAFTLYYNTNGGQGVFSSQPVKYGESVTVDSTAPTKTGYTFSGWNTAADGSGFDYSPRMTFTLNVEANVTLFAKWTAISYSLAYNANGGSGAPSGGSYNFGATVTTASKGSMALSGYRFIGWNDRADGTGTTYLEGATFSMPAENVILYAQWIDALFEIAYNANGGSGGPDGADVPDGTSYTVDPIQPVRPGYTFSGWKIADGTPTTSTYKAGTSTQTFTISGNEVLVAQWTIKTITVTYDLNGGGGTTPTAGSGNYNSNITLASSSGVSRSNFQFVGWSTTPDGTGTTYVDGSSYKLPANDVILYAKWAPVYYVIEYNAAGGTGEPADQFATPSSTVAIATQEPTKTGYEFDKWTEVSQGTDFTPGASLTMPSSNVVLVANYTVRTAGVPGSGSGSNTGVVDPGTKPISKPKELVLSVYFRGDSPVLTERAKMHLRKLAATAKSYGRANNITIYGRVKETNDKSYDLRLSRARAANVAAYLKKYGVTGVFKVYAKGISPENTFKSRRVDMKLWWAK